MVTPTRRPFIPITLITSDPLPPLATPAATPPPPPLPLDPVPILFRGIPARSRCESDVSEDATISDSETKSDHDSSSDGRSCLPVTKEARPERLAGAPKGSRPPPHPPAEKKR